VWLALAVAVAFAAWLIRRQASAGPASPRGRKLRVHDFSVALLRLLSKGQMSQRTSLPVENSAATCSADLPREIPRPPGESAGPSG
jgi:hypothetical protein